MLKVKTSNFGELEVKEEDMIIFPQGIPAFEELRKFVIIDHGDDSPFHFLQSLEEGDLAFVVAETMTFFPQYQVKLSKQNLADIKVEDEKDVVILVMVTIPEDPKQMTANLQAPIIINGKERLGKQAILENSHYTTKSRLFPEIPTSSEGYESAAAIQDKG